MLVINCVELIALNQPRQVGKLHRDDTAGGKQDLQAGDEVVEVGYLGEHVIAD